MDKLNKILNEIDAILDESAGANGALARYRRAAGRDGAVTDSHSTKRTGKEVSRWTKMHKEFSEGGSSENNPSAKENREYFKKLMDKDLKFARTDAQESKNFSNGKINGVKSGYSLEKEQTIDKNYANPKDIAKYDRQNRKVSEIHDKINKRAQNESTTDILDDIDYLLNS